MGALAISSVVYIATNINTDKPCVLIFVSHRAGLMEQLHERNEPVEQQSLSKRDF
jgi:hypothetical protein